MGVRGIYGWGIPNTPWFFSTPNFDAPSRWEGEYLKVVRLLPSSSLLDPPNKGLYSVSINFFGLFSTLYRFPLHVDLGPGLNLFPLRSNINLTAFIVHHFHIKAF